MAFSQPNVPLPALVLGKGRGLICAMIDRGPRHDLIWVATLDETGKISCAPKPWVGFRENWPMGGPAPMRRLTADDAPNADATGTGSANAR